MTAGTRRSLQAQLADRLGSAREARWMVEEVLGRDGAPGTLVGDDAAGVLGSMAERRAAGEPLQYVLGAWAFRGLELAVDPRALIPRPETEQVVEVALAELRRIAAARASSGVPEQVTAANPAGARSGPVSDAAGPAPDAAGPPGVVVVDLGTGSGAIALSVVAELGTEGCRLEVWATDVDPAALALARANRDRVAAALPWVAERVRLRAGSWFGALPEALAGRVDLVVSNPPYVSEEEWGSLDPDVRREPRRALVAATAGDGTPGLAAVEAVLVGSVYWLAPGGAVVVELAPHQAGPAARIAGGLGYRAVRVLPDLAGRDRVLALRR